MRRVESVRRRSFADSHHLYGSVWVKILLLLRTQPGVIEFFQICRNNLTSDISFYTVKMGCKRGRKEVRHKSECIVGLLNESARTEGRIKESVYLKGTILGTCKLRQNRRWRTSWIWLYPSISYLFSLQGKIRFQNIPDPSVFVTYRRCSYKIRYFVSYYLIN